MPDQSVTSPCGSTQSPNGVAQASPLCYRQVPVCMSDYLAFGQSARQGADLLPARLLSTLLEIAWQCRSSVWRAHWPLCNGCCCECACATIVLQKSLLCQAKLNGTIEAVVVSLFLFFPRARGVPRFCHGSSSRKRGREERKKTEWKMTKKA